MRLLKIMLPLLALLLWSAAVSADYNPANPPEPGVNFTLTTRSIPERGASSMTGTAPHAFGSTVRMEASPSTGFSFVQWEDEEGNVVSTERNFNYIMPARDVTLIARFIYNPGSPGEPGTPVFKEYSKVNLEVFPSGAGYFSNTSGQSYEVGTTKRFDVRTNTNYRFVNVTRDGEVVSTSTGFDYTIPSGDHTLVANFEYSPSSPGEPGEQHFMRTLTLKSNPEGGGSVHGGGQLLDGTRQRVYTDVNKYYTFVNWTDENGDVVSEARDFYYTMPNRNVILTANYTYNYNPASPGEPGVPNPDGSIAKNMVAYPRFGMYDDTHVMILCETEGATIHYTLDGTDPTASSPVYTEPVYVESNLLVKAIAFKEGMEDSPVRSYRVSTYRTAAPVFTFVNRKMVLSSETPGAVIRYTLDFSEPNAESEVYTTPLEPEENCRIKAYASKEGLSDSRISVFVYRKSDYTIAAPAFSLNDEGKLVITPAVEGGKTYYTYTPEGTDPDASGTLYEGPLTLDGNGKIRAFTTHVNYFDSPIGEYVAEGFKVGRPAYGFTNPSLTFTVPTAGAEIRYTLDGSVPTEESALYSGAIRFTEDGRVVARGFKKNYEPSDTVSFNYVYKDYMVPTPTASFGNRVLTLTCADALAQIHYTTDGTEPTSASALYEAPFALTADCTVKFFAMRENFNDSEVAVFGFKKADYQVAKPKITYDPDNGTATMSTATENAEIRYTIDGTVPTATTGTVYTAPITVDQNETLTAVAFRSDLFDSEVTTYSVNDRTVPTPTASFGNRVLTLTCADALAQIHYTTDGTEPTSASALYQAPITMTADCTVKFFAMRENFNDSETGSFVFVLADYQEAKPEIGKDFRGRKITVTHADNLSVRITIGGETADYPTPHTLDVSPEMEKISVTALTGNPDRYNSVTVEEGLVFHQAPKIEYNGHSITVNLSDSDPHPDNAERVLYYNNELHADAMEVDGFGRASALVLSDAAFRSDTTTVAIDFFNTGRKAGARNGHRLAESFGTWGDDAGDYTYLHVVGDAAREDLEFISTLPELTTLFLNPERMETEPCDSVFAGTRIETVSINSAPEGLLKGMPRLTTVLWRPSDTVMPDGIMADAGNPNILLWLADKDNAPADARNVVICGNAGEESATAPESNGIEGHAERIILQPGFPYNAHKPVAATRIMLTKEFVHETEIGVCRGWESIALPFMPDTIYHETQGEIVPYALWEGKDDSAKPFWLYEATPEDWKPADTIRTGVPYIISMPNNPEYVEAYNLAGRVTFAAENVMLGTEESSPRATEWIDGMSFNAAFMPVEEADLLSLNNEWEAPYGNILPGSVFTADAGTLPFEGYVTWRGGSRSIPVFSDWSGLELPTVSPYGGITVEPAGPGSIRICSVRAYTADIYTLTGMKVRSADIAPGESVVVDGLARGIYIVAGVKVMVD